MVPQKVLEQLLTIAEKYSDIQRILLFGSRAYGDHHDRSDIDLAIIASQMTNHDWLKFSDQIEEIDTLLKFDLLRYETASSAIQSEINQCHRLLYVKEEGHRDRLTVPKN